MGWHVSVAWGFPFQRAFDDNVARLPSYGANRDAGGYSTQLFLQHDRLGKRDTTYSRRRMFAEETLLMCCCVVNEGTTAKRRD